MDFALERVNGRIDVLNGSGVPARIHLRLWSSQPLPAGGLQTNSDNPSIFMIIDLVEAVGGSLCEESGLSAQFDAASHALSAAKHIQRALLEFSDHSTSQKIGSAILVTEADPKSDPEIHQTLDQAQPGQILVASSLRKMLPENAAWRFRSLTSNSATGILPTAEELLWTDQATYDHLAELVRSGETWSVTSEPPSTVEAQVAESTTFDPTQIPIATHSYETTGIFEAIEPPPRSKAPYMIAAGVILAALLGGYAFLHYSQSQQPMAQPSTSVASGSTASKPPEPATTPPLKVQKVEAAETATKAAEASVNPPTQPVHSTPAMVASKTPPDKPPAPTPMVRAADEGVANPGPASSGSYHMTAAERAEASKAAVGISPKQINQILAMADEQAGDGKFSEARKKYLVVLYLDSKNAAANRGMLRLVRQQQEADR